MATSETKSKTKVLNPTLALELLKKSYPDAHCELIYSNPFELLVATVLSAQCTDQRVNKVTPVLFEKYPDAFSMAKASVVELEDIIRSTGFFRSKAKNLQMMAEVIGQKYNGNVPQEMDQLTELAGVGRKTANVVLGNAFQIPSGVVVDTHVARLSNRMGWVSSLNPVQIELVLQALMPKEDWILISHLLISHGRAVCKARNPQCVSCFLADHCPQKL